MKVLFISQRISLTVVIVYLLNVGIGATHAAVVNVSGTVVFENTPYPPESDDVIFVFSERQNIPFVGSQPLNFGSIETGTFVNSHYIQYDPESSTGFVGTGTVTFDGPILGVITTTANLNADLNPEVSGTSDTYFGLETLFGSYPTGADPSARGLGSAEDDIIITIGTNTLVIDSLEIPVPGNLDGFRILTAVPLPPALLLFGSACVALYGLGRARKPRATDLA